MHHPAVPRGWNGEHINIEKDRLSAVFFYVYRLFLRRQLDGTVGLLVFVHALLGLVIIMDKTCCGAVQVENGSPFWAAAQKKHALANRWYRIAFLSVVLFLSAYNRCADNSTAADEQKCAPQNGITAVTGI